MKGIAYRFPAGQQLVEDFAIGAGGIVEQYDCTRMNSSKQLFEGFLMGGLGILLPVYVGKTPEEGLLA